jgi:hypothetical protein
MSSGAVRKRPSERLALCRLASRSAADMRWTTRNLLRLEFTASKGLKSTASAFLSKESAFGKFTGQTPFPRGA